MMITLVKKAVYFLFIVLAVGCKDDEKFDPYSYDGEYPRNLDGGRIKTYTPTITGGEVDVQFNGHSWDHAPFLSLSVSESIPSSTSGKLVEISIYSLLDNNLIEPCALESVYFRTALNMGKTNRNNGQLD